MIKRRTLSTLLFITALLIAASFHGFGMFQYPYFESDEGTYISQAWSVVEEGALSPYTYWYDHPPGGWIFIAAWTYLFSDGFFAFGSSIETGRAFMWVIHIMSAAFIYGIVRYVTGRSLPAFAAAVLFSISPLAIYFQRRVLIDSLMIFWVLAAMVVLCQRFAHLRLRHYILSGVFFAFACLTKLTAVFFGPAFLYFLWTHHTPVQRYFRIPIWMMISGMFVSSFFLFAALSGELFKSESGESVSFMGAVEFQASRYGGVFWDPESAFASAIQDWAEKDFLFTLMTLTILVASFFMIPLFRNVRFLLISMIPYVFFLTSGGVNFNFYILPLIPVVAMIWAIYIHNILSSLGTKMYTTAFVFVIAITGLYYGIYGTKDHFVRDETSNQKESTIWIKENLDNEDVILIDNFAYVDLHDPRYINEKTFPNADWYYKVSRDIEVGEQKYDLDWRNFDFLSVTHEMMKQIQEGQDPIIRTAYEYGYPYKKWTKDATAFIDLPKMISTNGDWTMLYRIAPSPRETLFDAWKKYRSRSLYSYGQMVDLQSKQTTSSGQAQAMLQAVMVNDQDGFKGIWSWTKNQLQWRVQDRLFASSWVNGTIGNDDNTTSADSDIAMALLLAAHTWETPEYAEAAQEIIKSLWEGSVVTINDRYYMLPHNKISAQRYENKYLLNPSYFSPAWYRIFAEADPQNDWSTLADDTYKTLEDISRFSTAKDGLPPNWLAVDEATGRLSSASVYFSDPRIADQFGKDAVQTLWRISVDAKWFRSEDAGTYLKKIVESLDRRQEASLPTIVDNAGRTQSVEPSYVNEAGYANALAVFDTIANQASPEGESRADQYYAKTLAQAFDDTYSRLGRTPAAQEANWAWLGYALYNDVFRNVLLDEY